MTKKISVVLPCLNEELTLATCINKARKTLEKIPFSSEIVVADNGSTDRSVEIAESLGCRIVHEPRKGYGSAYRAGIHHAEGEWIIIADSDDSYDLTDLQRFIEPLKEGADFVIGDRLNGDIKPGAMPWLHKYIGNPVLTGLLNLFFKANIGDAHCGMRAFTRTAYDKMKLQTTGMEFASEMVIKAVINDMNIKQIPITLYPDGRERRPHLRSFRDGWRHLRFMLLFSPTYLYLWPGLLFFLVGLFVLLWLLPGPIQILGRSVDLHLMVLASLLTILGFQLINLGIYAKIYAVTHGFIPMGRILKQSFQLFNLERGLLAGGIMSFIGLGLAIYIFQSWMSKHEATIFHLRLALVASTLLTVGVQTLFSSFFLSMLGIDKRPYEINHLDDL